MTSSPTTFMPALEGVLRGTGRIDTSALRRLAMANDASHYALTPAGVVYAESEREIAAILHHAARAGVGVTFRGGGSSLSGQSVTEGLLVDTRRHFRDVEVIEDGAAVRVGPGPTIAQVNARLAPYGTKLGPDPASVNACTIGGLLANNSSGMSCGTELNSYRTMRSMRVVLAGGTIVDTAEPDADDRLRALEPDLWAGLSQLRDGIRSDPAQVAEITRQFARKNTMGYGINSFLDHDSPAQILTHLMIGSEGTLGWVSSAVLDTVRIKPKVATTLLVFDDLVAATDALEGLKDTQATAIELLDRQSLYVADHNPVSMGALPPWTGQAAALLIDYEADTEAELADRARAFESLLPTLRLQATPALTTDPAYRARMWSVRKGLYAAVLSNRPQGTTGLLEDIAVPVPELSGVCERLAGIIDRHGYDPAVIFGHAKDGNIHFLINEHLGDSHGVERLGGFTEDLVDLVLSVGGALKAEHGTGRIMAPFVERQYGPQLYAVMRRVKELCDPAGVLNPGVLIGDDPQAHVKNLKPVTPVEEEVDRCVECGFCEHACPSVDLTLTPRQRIVLRRHLAAAELAGRTQEAAELADGYLYEGTQTCAVDGMCGLVCPVGINTGDLTRRLRREGQTRTTQALGRAAANTWAGIATAGGLGVSAAATAHPAAGAVTRGLRKLVGDARMYQWSAELPHGGKPRHTVNDTEAEVVLFASCMGGLFGPAGDGPGAGDALVSLLRKAGIHFRTPAKISGLCCGTPWKSKGLSQGYAVMSAKVRAALLAATDGGRLPIICEASSCTEGLLHMLHEVPELTIVDATAYVVDKVLPVLDVERRLGSVVLHPTCATRQLGSDTALTTIARAIADEVVVPVDWGCCAFAGDRGMLHPELTRSATRREAANVAEREYDAYLSSNRTCEMGMTRATGRPYRGALEVLDEVTRARV